MNSVGEVRNSCPLLENIESDLNSDPEDSKLSFSLHSYRHIEPGVCFHLQFLSACWFYERVVFLFLFLSAGYLFSIS